MAKFLPVKEMEYVMDKCNSISKQIKQNVETNRDSELDWNRIKGWSYTWDYLWE